MGELSDCDQDTADRNSLAKHVSFPKLRIAQEQMSNCNLLETASKGSKMPALVPKC